jgi:hypothetical protein
MFLYCVLKLYCLLDNLSRQTANPSVYGHICVLVYILFHSSVYLPY